MKSLFEYDVLVNHTFYRSWHILEYIEKHPDMSELDREAIKATIMDALVYDGAIDPDWEYLDLDNLCISGDPAGYEYDIHPNVAGIPMWLKEEMRHKSIVQSASIPISMYLARPAAYPDAYCLYDPCYSLSYLFDEFTVYVAKYISPTRGTKTKNSRPFIEVDLNGELYLVDVLTKRIFKSSWFKETFQMEVIDQNSLSKFNRKQRKMYRDQGQESINLATHLSFVEEIRQLMPKAPKDAEMDYEVEMSKINYPEEWERYKIMKQEMKEHIASMKMTGV